MPKGKTNNPNGRPKGSKNKTTQMMEEWFEKDVVKMLDLKHPATILLMIASDEDCTATERANAAKAVLPYIKSRMPVITEISGRDGDPIEFATDSAKDELERLLALTPSEEDGEHVH